MKISKHANNLLNEFGRMQFDFVITLNNSPVPERDTARNNLADYIAELEAEVTKSHELQDSYCDRIAELEVYRDGYDPKVNPPAISQWVLAHSKSFGWRTVKYYGQLYFDEGVSGVGFSVSDCIRWYPLPPEVK